MFKEQELSEDMLENEGELGHGNGGVVHKVGKVLACLSGEVNNYGWRSQLRPLVLLRLTFQVIHKKNGVTMARKLVHLEVKPSVRQQIVKGMEYLSGDSGRM